MNCDLVDKDFDIEPLLDVPGRASGWTDRATGLSFAIEAERDDNVDLRKWWFTVRDRAHLPGDFIVYCTIEMTERSVRPKKSRKFQISRAAIFSKMGSGGPDATAIREGVVGALGGEDGFFSYCLKAIKACHVKYLGEARSADEIFHARKLADEVTFVITA